jgi:hypothetical protein
MSPAYRAEILAWAFVIVVSTGTAIVAMLVQS